MKTDDTQPQRLTRDELAKIYVELLKSAEKEIWIIAGEFYVIENKELMDSLIEKLMQGISVNIYIHDPKPERKKIDNLISHGAKVFLTKDNSRHHYFAVDHKSLSYHSHKRYDDVLLKGKEITDEHLLEFNQTLEIARCDAYKLPHSKLFVFFSMILMIGLFCLAIYILPFPLNICVGIFYLAPFFLGVTILKNR